MFGGMVKGLPEAPKLPGGGESGGDSAMDEALKEVEELQTKLEQSKERIYGCLEASVPRIHIELPKLDPSVFAPPAPAAESEYQPLSQSSAAAGSSPHWWCCAAPGGLLASAAAASGEALAASREALATASGEALAAAKSASGEALADAEAGAGAVAAGSNETLASMHSAQEQGALASAEAERQAQQALAAADRKAQQAATSAASWACSVAASLAIGSLPLGPLAGPMLSGVTSSIICTLGFAYMWNSKADGVFAILSAVFGRLTGAVLKVLDTVDDVMRVPVNQLEGMLDAVAKEQRPALEKARQFESTIKKLDPDFDIPDPADLKKPLEGCEATIDDIVNTAKVEVPARLEEAMKSTTIGHAATDRAVFRRFVVFGPLALVLLVNMLIAVTQVYSAFLLSGHVGHGAGSPTAVAAPRRLRGDAHPHSLADAAPGAVVVLNDRQHSDREAPSGRAATADEPAAERSADDAKEQAAEPPVAERSADNAKEQAAEPPAAERSADDAKEQAAEPPAVERSADDAKEQAAEPLAVERSADDAKEQAAEPPAAERSADDAKEQAAEPPAAEWSADDAKEQAKKRMMASLQPALVQVLMSMLQTVAAWIFALRLMTARPSNADEPLPAEQRKASGEEPLLCRLVNDQIVSLQTSLNERVNKRVEGAVNRVFGQAFSEVREKADDFFPKFAGCLDKLKDAMKQAAKLEAATGAAADVARKFGF